MTELLLPINCPNEYGFADDTAVLKVWEDVHDLLSRQNAIFVVSGKPTEWFSVSVDASRIIRQVEWHIASREHPTAGVSYEEGYEDLTLRLHVEPAGTSDGIAGFPTDRFIEQLFLACNLAVPGSCAFTSPDHVIRLDSELIGASAHLGRFPIDDESIEADHWPEIRPVSFAEAWGWLQDDLSYDVELARTPAQVAIFTLIMLASRTPLDPDSILAVSRAIEALFGHDARENIRKAVDDRIERAFGQSVHFPRWFAQFYDQRSRIIHGGKQLLRPGLTHPKSPEAVEWMDAHTGPLTSGVRLLLASVNKMIRSGRRDLEA